MNNIHNNDNGNDNGNDDGDVAPNFLLNVDPTNQFVAPNNTPLQAPGGIAFTHEAKRLWDQGVVVANQRQFINNHDPTVLLPPVPPILEIKEKCLLTLAVISSREELEREEEELRRRREVLRELQDCFGLQAGL